MGQRMVSPGGRGPCSLKPVVYSPPSHHFMPLNEHGQLGRYIRDDGLLQRLGAGEVGDRKVSQRTLPYSMRKPVKSSCQAATQ